MAKHNYTCDVEMRQEQVFWSVIEVSTNQTIRSFFFEDDALEYADFLESGGGFAGFTPEFMLREVEVKANLNEKFISNFP